MAYDLVARSVAAGLLERVRLLVGEPSLIRATRAGIKLSGLGLLAQPLWLEQWSHWIACADAAIWAERRWGAENLTASVSCASANLLRASRSRASTSGPRPMDGDACTAPTSS